TVKSMGLSLLTVNIQFEKVTRRILQSIRKTIPLKLEVNKTDVDVTVREEQQALQILVLAKQHGSIKHFEVSSATLEDVFVELVDKKASGS
ncbi:MAG: ABC transporter domain-containing protein, partial [Bacteroidetes bacterium]|nr:ABC transporter domain-containing protein [Bacteroidota bacterium]